MACPVQIEAGEQSSASCQISTAFKKPTKPKRVSSRNITCVPVGKTYHSRELSYHHAGIVDCTTDGPSSVKRNAIRHRESRRALPAAWPGAVFYSQAEVDDLSASHQPGRRSKWSQRARNTLIMESNG